MDVPQLNAWLSDERAQDRALATTEIRGVGGEYLVQVQATDEWTCADAWLYAAIVATNVAGTRVYPGKAPETAVLTSAGVPLAFVTFTSKDADPDTRTYGPSGGVVANLRYDVIVWKQGQTFAGLSDLAATVRTALDVANVTTASGRILGAARTRPLRGQYTPVTP